MIRRARLARRKGELVLLAVAALLFGLVAPVAPAFFEWGNLVGLAVDAAPLALLVLGMTAVLLAGEIDVSVGALFAVCGVVSGLVARAGLGPAGTVLATLLVGAGLGAGNGFLVARLRVPAILVTLAAMAGWRGVLRWWSGGQWVQDLPATYQWFGLGREGGQAAILVAALAVVLAGAAFLRWVHLGRLLPAVGCDPEVARLLGARPDAVRFATFVAMGTLCGAAALLSFPRYPAVEIEAGLGLELEVIACAVVGGVSIHGGRGTVLGAMLGVMLLSTLGTVLVFLHVDAAWERALQGLVILVAVAGDTARVRRGGGSSAPVVGGASEGAGSGGGA